MLSIKFSMQGKGYMKMAKRHIDKIVNKLVDIAWAGCVVLIVYFTMKIFVFSSFNIPSDSMNPELIEGDKVVVNKLTIGARLFNIYASMRDEYTPIYRLPGLKKIQRNDVLVFNSPHPHTWDKIELHLMKYFIKRCIALPGDTLLIQNGFYKINGIDKPVGNLQSQQRISLRDKNSFEECVFISYPYDSIMNWNIKNFGPIYIPKANDELVMDHTNFRLYGKLIEWEQQKNLVYKDSLVYLNDRPLLKYRFRKNYYFMGGDNGENSQDSRYWGLLPEDYIVGKAWLILKSSDPYSGTLHWDRFFKIIR